MKQGSVSVAEEERVETDSVTATKVGLQHWKQEWRTYLVLQVIVELAKLRYDALSSRKGKLRQEEVKERTTRKRTSSRCLKESIEGHLHKKAESKENTKGKSRSKITKRGLEHIEELQSKEAGSWSDATEECRHFKLGQCWYSRLACRYRHEREDCLYVLDPSVTLKTIDVEQYMHQFGKEVKVKLNKLGSGGSQFEVEMKRTENIVLGEHLIHGVKVVMETKREMDRKRRDAAELEEKRTYDGNRNVDKRQRSRTERRCSGDHYKGEFLNEGFEYYQRRENGLERSGRISSDWDLLRVDGSRERRSSNGRSKAEKRGRSKTKKGESSFKGREKSSSQHDRDSLIKKLSKKIRRDASSSVLREKKRRGTLSSCSELDTSQGRESLNWRLVVLRTW